MPKSPADDPAYVLLGEFGRAQGLKGELRLKSFTADPAAITDYAPFVTARGDAVAITVVRPAAGNQPEMLIVRVDGVTSREAADSLNRIGVYGERSRLAQPDEDDEFFHADLVGLKVFDKTGADIGTVAGVANYGGGDILEIEPGGLMVPFTKTFVPEVDMTAGRIVIDYAESEGSEEAETEA